MAEDQTSASFRGKGSATDSTPPAVPVETLEMRLLLGFALVIGILAAVVYMAIRNTLQTRETSLWVNNTHAVILEAGAIISSLNAMEAAQTAYMMRGAQVDFERWQRRLSDLNEHLQVAQALTADNPRQQEHFLKLQPLVRRRVEFSKKLVEARKQDGAEAARRLFMSEEASQTATQAEALAALLAHDENVLLARRDQTSVANARITRRILWAGLVLNGALLVGGYFLVRDDLKVRRNHAAQLTRVNDVLEQMVHERTSQLADSNEALSIENLERQWAYVALEKNYRRGELIVESLSEMVLLVGTTGLIHQSNPAAETAIQAGAGKTIGKHLQDILAPNEQGCAWDAHPVRQAMCANKSLTDQRGILLISHGSHRPVLYNMKPIQDSGQVVMAIVGIRST